MIIKTATLTMESGNKVTLKFFNGPTCEIKITDLIKDGTKEEERFLELAGILDKGMTDMLRLLGKKPNSYKKIN